MRDAGYVTPYYGKWHLSYYADELEKYGYDSHTKPDDLIGEPGQGFETDGEVARRAKEWFDERDPARPFFLNVNFINPHDKQWFWGGMHATDYHRVYEQIPEAPPRRYIKDFREEYDPTVPGYREPDIRDAINNWETEDRLTSTKPWAHTLIKEVFQYQMGGIFEPDKDTQSPPYYTRVPLPPDFRYAPTQLHAGSHKAIAPHEYWVKALNSYLEVTKMVDNHIGTFMQGVPADVMANTIFIFTSDHGEYGSSHGMQGKGGTIYEEGILVPLVVHDPGQRIFNSTGNRTQLCSSVDLLRMIVSMGYGGTTEWMTGDFEQLYGNRNDLLSFILNPSAVGKNYAIHTTDEFISNSYNYLDAPLHVIGLIQMDGEYKQKLGVYTNWTAYQDGQTQAQVLNEPGNYNVTQLEYYDYHTDGGRKETENTAYSSITPTRVVSPQAQAALNFLMGGGTDEILPLLGSELQVPLPTKYQKAQQDAYMQLRFYEMNVNNPVILTNEEEKQERLLGVWAY